jgi:hypothetical protein
MSVRKKLEMPKIEDIDVDALIDKGAKVKEDQISEAKKWTYMNLRIPVEMINLVDEAVDKSVGITRTGWILQAINEKLKKEVKNE